MRATPNAAPENFQSRCFLVATVPWAASIFYYWLSCGRKVGVSVESSWFGSLVFSSVWGDSVSTIPCWREWVDGICPLHCFIRLNPICSERNRMICSRNLAKIKVKSLKNPPKHTKMALLNNPLLIYLETCLTTNPNEVFLRKIYWIIDIADYIKFSIRESWDLLRRSSCENVQSRKVGEWGEHSTLFIVSPFLMD